MKTVGVRMVEIIEKRQSELSELCTELIQAKSENPPGDVSEAANVVESFLKQEGISYQIFEPVERHRSVVASVGEADPSLILCGHIDVVPAGDVAKWKVHPYLGKIKRGKLYGRGATDMKGGVAAMLMALTAAKEYEKELSGKVSVASVSDEEALGPGGALWLLKNQKLAGDMCLITEPTGNLDGKYSIVGGERGAYWLKITAHGNPAHGSTPALGKNAIETLTQFIVRLKALEAEVVKTPKDAEVLVRNGQKELRRVAQKHGVPFNSLTRTLTHYTINLGVIAGGTKTNIVPEKCEAEVDIRVPPGGHPDGVKEFVRSILTEEVECQVINRSMPSYTAADQPLIKAIQKSARQVFGYRPYAKYMALTSDAHHFREILGIPTASFGPGYSELAHAYDEFVQLEDVKNAAEVYAHLIANVGALENS